MATLREIIKRTRTTILVLIATGMMVFSINETALSVDNVSVGLKSGLALAKFSGNDVSDTKWRTGFTGGGFLSFDLSRNFGIQTEILYVTKGNKFKEGAGVTSKYGYIAFPVLLKYLLPGEGSIEPGLYVGCEGAFNNSAKFTNGTELDIKSGIKNFDIGLIFGADFNLPAGSNAITIDVRLTRGLISFDDTITQLDGKHNVISMMLGYAFAL